LGFACARQYGPNDASRSQISVTEKREKCVDTPGTALTMALVSGSSAVLEEGVRKPISLRWIMVKTSARRRAASDR
jgi:hypothetical protein